MADPDLVLLDSERFRILKFVDQATSGKNKKIAILILTPTLNLTQTLTVAQILTLILAQNLTQTLTII